VRGNGILGAAALPPLPLLQQRAACCRGCRHACASQHLARAFEVGLMRRLLVALQRLQRVTRAPRVVELEHARHVREAAGDKVQDTSHVTPRSSHLTPHTSHHTSHLTPHTSHLTPHTTLTLTSHATRHAPTCLQRRSLRCRRSRPGAVHGKQQVTRRARQHLRAAVGREVGEGEGEGGRGRGRGRGAARGQRERLQRQEESSVYVSVPYTARRRDTEYQIKTKHATRHTPHATRHTPHATLQAC